MKDANRKAMWAKLGSNKSHIRKRTLVELKKDIDDSLRINNYLRNPESRYGTSNFSYDKNKQYQIIDRGTGKHHYYRKIEDRNRAFRKLIGIN